MSNVPKVPDISCFLCNCSSYIEWFILESGVLYHDPDHYEVLCWTCGQLLAEVLEDR